MINQERMSLIVENLKYELKDDLYSLTVPKIKTPEDTIRDLIENKKSISRFGDGEFMLAFGQSIPFQKYSPELGTRLKEILISKRDIPVGIGRYFFYSLRNALPLIKTFVRTWVYENREKMLKLMDLNKQYYSTEFSQLYMTYREYDYEVHFKNVRKIWEKRDVVIIQGKGVLNNFKYNVFDNTSSLEHLIAPSKDAFLEYESILKKAIEIPKDKLVIFILGPTATVLAYDLANLGY
jgi:glycosyltransferase family protein